MGTQRNENATLSKPGPICNHCLVALPLAACRFEGDTSAAMGEVALNPAQKTALSRLVPCADPSVTANLGAFTRYMGYTTVALVNRTIVKSAPQVFTKVLKTPRGLCNPFGPPPMYKFDNSTCFKPQKPCKKEKGKKCPARVIDYPTLITVCTVNLLFSLYCTVNLLLLLYCTVRYSEYCTVSTVQCSASLSCAVHYCTVQCGGCPCLSFPCAVTNVPWRQHSNTVLQGSGVGSTSGNPRVVPCRKWPTSRAPTTTPTRHASPRTSQPSSTLGKRWS